MTTKSEISGWFDQALNTSADYLIVVCDTYDWIDYPIYCSAKNYLQAYKAHDGKNMQKIMEVYDLSMDRDSQLLEHRAFHPPKG